jgi:hypothetical protein
MWTTRLDQAATPPGALDVILSRDGSTFAVISLDEWWIMSASQFLANRALEANDLNFKADEVRGPSRIQHPVWTTELIQSGHEPQVHLLRDGAVVASMRLDEWAALSATEFVVEDTVEVAQGLAQYGDNIDEVNQSLKDEESFEDEDLDEPDAQPPHQAPKR